MGRKIKINDHIECDEFRYIHYFKRDNFKLDEDDTENYYCRYCKKKMKLRSYNRHIKSEDHYVNKSLFKEYDLTDQIYIRLVADFEAGKYDPNDVNLTGLKKINRFKQLEKETWEKYNKASVDGYFDQLDDFEEIDFEDYNFYHEKGIKLNLRKEFHNAPEFRTYENYFDDSDDDSDDELEDDDE